MAMLNDRLEQLYLAYMDNSITAAEKQELWELLTDPAHEEAVKVLMDARFEMGLPAFAQSDASADAMFVEITALHRVVPMRRKLVSRRWWAVAAAVALLIGTGVYLSSRQSGTITPPQLVTNDAAPGREGAVLTLANGQQVVLDSLGNAVVAVQNGTQLIVQNGQLIYDPATDATGEPAYNIITTPRGRQFSVVLPDGSKAWMNAASSLRYPVAFNGNTRTVEVTGEAYFEVAKQADRPFFVKVAGGPEIQVLGTSFNINAYPDELAIHTTLLTGSVRVIAREGAQPVVLKPGQEAKLIRNTGKMETGQADEEQAMAWKNGNFYFDGADMKEIMREMARWYDLEVVFGQVPEKRFSGTIPRNVNASQVFKILESTNNVHFKIEGNRVTVEQ